MRNIISFEMSKGKEQHRLELIPVLNAPKYQIFIDGRLRYMGKGFRLDDCLQRLAFFEQEGFDVRILSRRTKRSLKRFKRKIDESSATAQKSKGPAKPPKGKRPGLPMQRSLFD